MVNKSIRESYRSNLKKLNIVLVSIIAFIMFIALVLLYLLGNNGIAFLLIVAGFFILMFIVIALYDIIKYLLESSTASYIELQEKLKQESTKQ